MIPIEEAIRNLVGSIEGLEQVIEERRQNLNNLNKAYKILLQEQHEDITHLEKLESDLKELQQK